MVGSVTFASRIIGRPAIMSFAVAMFASGPALVFGPGAPWGHNCKVGRPAGGCHAARCANATHDNEEATINKRNLRMKTSDSKFRNMIAHCSERRAKGPRLCAVPRFALQYALEVRDAETPIIAGFVDGFDAGGVGSVGKFVGR